MEHSTPPAIFVSNHGDVTQPERSPEQNTQKKPRRMMCDKGGGSENVTSGGRSAQGWTRFDLYTCRDYAHELRVARDRHQKMSMISRLFCGGTSEQIQALRCLRSVLEFWCIVDAWVHPGESPDPPCPDTVHITDELLHGLIVASRSVPSRKYTYIDTRGMLSSLRYVLERCRGSLHIRSWLPMWTPTSICECVPVSRFPTKVA